jgi:hypothetical protein
VEDALWALGSLAVAVALLAGARRITPHRAAADGSSCTAEIRDLRDGALTGRSRRRNVGIGEGDVLVEGVVWPLAGESPDPPRRRAVFVAGDHRCGLVLSVPADSPAATRLRAALGRRC